MGDFASWSERRSALRVPVRGIAVFRDDCSTRAIIENLSSGGALLEVKALPADGELELKLGNDSGIVCARTVRVERRARRTRIAVIFDRVEPAMRAAIDAVIDHAVNAAQRRQILIIDDQLDRRTDLVRRLAASGMSPLAADTPLDAIELLTRTQLLVSACLIAPSFGHTTAELRAVVSDSFPWVSTAEISDDLEDTVERAVLAWSTTDVARLARAIA